MRYIISSFGMAVLLLASGMAGAADDDLPKMKFNEVKEVAPGVFFRYSAISATDTKVAFGGSNNIWVVFEDYVVVIDANFPQGAEEVIEAVKRVCGRSFPVSFAAPRPGDPVTVVADVSRIRAVLDWTPQLDHIDTIAAHALAFEQRLQERARSAGQNAVSA